MEHGGHTIILNDLLHTDFKDEIENVLNEYPIFDEEYRKILNEKIINHYRFREIGFYSPDKFNYKLYVKLNEILPFYNVMYKKLLKENFDIFNDYDPTETYDGTNDEIAETKSNDETSSTGSNSSTDEYKKGKRETKNLESDTPQGNTSIASILSGGYLSKFNQAEESSSQDTTTNTGSAESKSTGIGKVNSSRDGVTNYIRKVTGYQGRDNIELFNKYLKSLLNIDLLIIKELEELFFIFY